MTVKQIKDDLVGRSRFNHRASKLIKTLEDMNQKRVRFKTENDIITEVIL